MQRGGTMRQLLAVFLIAAGGYALLYLGIEHRRTRNGPWQVTFSTNHAGWPELTIEQPKLRIAPVQLLFPGQPNPPTGLPAAPAFAQPQPVPYPLPFGQCVFVDSTFLPGTLTFEMFGHEIELLPRVLIVDHEEHAWKTTTILTLSPASNPPSSPVRGGQGRVD